MNQQIKLFLAGRKSIVNEVKALLKESLFFSCTQTATNGKEAVKQIKNNGAEIDLFLLDSQLPEFSGIKVAEFISLTLGKPSIIVSEAANPQLMRKAMLAGVREFLVLPLRPAELDFALTRVYELDQERQKKNSGQRLSALNQGHLLAFISAKGGVGKSTLAALTALALAAENPKRTHLLVEVKEGSSDLAVMLDKKVEKSLGELLPLAAEMDTLNWQAAVKPLTKNLQFLAAGGLETDQDGNLPTLLKHLLQHYNIVIADLSLKFTASLLSLADFFVVITVPEVVPVRLTGELLANLSQNGLSQQNILLVINQNNAQFLSSQQVEDYLFLNVALEVPELPLIKQLINEGRLLESPKEVLQLVQGLTAKINEELLLV